MELERIRKFIHSVLLLIFGVFEIILLIRITLRLIGASVESSFVKFWYDLSRPIFSFYDGTLGEIVSGKIVFEVDSIIGVIIFIIATLIAVKIVNGVFEPSFKGKMQSFLDSLFKIAEIILGMRLVFKLLGAGKSSFIAILYGISSIFYEPFKGILPTIETESLKFETATLVAIVIIVILDYMSDKLIQEIFKVDTMPTSSNVPQGTMPVGQQNLGGGASVQQQLPTYPVSGQIDGTSVNTGYQSQPQVQQIPQQPVQDPVQQVNSIPQQQTGSNMEQASEPVPGQNYYQEPVDQQSNPENTQTEQFAPNKEPVQGFVPSQSAVDVNFQAQDTVQPSSTSPQDQQPTSQPQNTQVPVNNQPNSYPNTPPPSSQPSAPI
ncbi:MAG: hypothetical protein ABIE03_04630 [Patescibacteria group bacterium]|nr:hypothetical protein [Patescibacteria group bacterium]